MIRFLLAAIALARCLTAQTQPLRQAEVQLEEGRSTLDEHTLLMARQAFADCLQRDANNAPCAYDLARTESYLIRVKESQKDKKAADRWLDSAIESARRLVALNDKSAEAHALLADLYGAKIGSGGALAAMRYGSKADGENQRAFQLDANNPRAHQVAGRKALYAPRMFGGDIDKAIESFRKAATLDPRSDEAFVWLAIAYRKKGNETSAKSAIAEALRLNPRSVFAKRIQAGATD